MPADIIIYALVAAGLVFWLRNVLGTRHGEERDRSNPYLSPAENTSPAARDNPAVPAAAPEQGAEEKIAMLGRARGQVFSVENKTAENGLLDILRADRNFDAGFFLEGAQEAFVMIVEAFAKGDHETLKDLLSEDVCRAFEGAIAERQQRGETQVTDIHSIRRAEILEAGIRDKTARITVRFTADETSVTRDAEGQILSGHPDRVSEMRDIWTFARDVKSRDPRWLVVETRGDFEEDNDLIPNAG